MPNFHHIARRPYIQNFRTAKIFAFPIQGLTFSKSKAYTFGYTTLYQRDEFEKEIAKRSDNVPLSFKSEAVAVVDLSTVDSTYFKYGDTHSYALRVLKEVLGAMHVLVHNDSTQTGEKKITISELQEPELEEGLVCCWGIGKDGFISRKSNFILLDLGIWNVADALNTPDWKSLFDTPLDKRNNYQETVFKLLEIAYYSCNDIHANNRMIDWFIGLNHALRKTPGENLKRPRMGSLLSVVFKKTLNKNVFSINFSTGFEDLYGRMRNDILHGILPTDPELSPVGSDDFFALKQLFLELVSFYVENPIVNSSQTMEQAIDAIEAHGRS